MNEGRKNKWMKNKGINERMTGECVNMRHEEWMKKDCMNERMMGNCMNVRMIGECLNMREWRMNKRMNVWINERKNERMNKRMNEWRMNGRMQKWMRICIKSTLHFKLDFAVQCSKQFSSGQSNLKLIINWGNPDIHSSNMYLHPYSWNNISQNFINKK